MIYVQRCSIVPIKCLNLVLYEFQASLEFIKFDNNDRGSQSGFGGSHPYGPEEDLFNTKVYYCYYEPGEESTEDLGLGKKVLTKVCKLMFCKI